ncbi:MAG: GIY-YIG nuclease family protein [Candidatus Levyibacteriota bacterium]
MYYTYILLCLDLKNKKKKFYIGSSGNLKERIFDHKTKSVETTKIFDKIELVYYEACPNRTDAIKREKQLKTGFGRGYIKRRLEKYLNDMRW